MAAVTRILPPAGSLSSRRWSSGSLGGLRHAGLTFWSFCSSSRGCLQLTSRWQVRVLPAFLTLWRLGSWSAGRLGTRGLSGWLSSFKTAL